MIDAGETVWPSRPIVESLARVCEAKVPHTPGVRVTTRAHASSQPIMEVLDETRLERQRCGSLCRALRRRRSAMSRRRLPSRRPSITVEIVHDGCVYAVILGFDPADWWLGEVFAHGAKVGSAMDGTLDDGCIALSLLLQHSVEPAALSAVDRLHSTRPQSTYANT